MQGDPPVNTTDPSLSGTARDGQTLTLDDGDWSGTPALVPAYQWQRCDASGGDCADIAGETGLTYTLQGRRRRPHGARASSPSRTPGARPPRPPTRARSCSPRRPPVTIDPSVTRHRRRRPDRQRRSRRVGRHDGPVDFTYQWLRCDLDGTNCTDIAGATDEHYTLTSADAGHGIRVEVTGTNAAGSATGTSAVAAVNALAPQNTTPPTISGSLVDGHTLTADDGTWSGTTPLHFDYQWLRCDADGTNCVAIPGATGASYDLTGDDIGHEILVSVQATNSAGNAAGRLGARGRRRRGRPAARRHRAGDHRQCAGRRHAERRHRHLDRHRPDRLHVPVAALRRRRIELRRHRRRDELSTYTLTRDRHRPGACASSSPAPTSPATTPRPRRRRAAVTAAPPVSTTAPSIAGVTVDGQTLTADHGTCSGTGAARLHATSGSAATPTAPTASTSSARPARPTTSSRATSAARSASSSPRPTAPAATARPPRPPPRCSPSRPPTSTPPSISGTPLDGHTLTADPGTWTGHAADRLRLPVAALRRRRLAAASTSSAPRTTPTRWCRATSTTSSASP